MLTHLPKALNLALLILFPVAWMAPLLHAGLTSFFGGRDISVLSGLMALWETDKLLALVVAFFALVAPMAKTMGMAAYHWGILPDRAKPALTILAKLAMADIFLMALYVVIVKGTGIGYVETAWGLWLFSGCVLMSLALSLWPQRA